MCVLNTESRPSPLPCGEIHVPVCVNVFVWCLNRQCSCTAKSWILRLTVENPEKIMENWSWIPEKNDDTKNLDLDFVKEISWSKLWLLMLPKWGILEIQFQIMGILPAVLCGNPRTVLVAQRIPVHNTLSFAYQRMKAKVAFQVPDTYRKISCITRYILDQFTRSELRGQCYSHETKK